MTTDQLTDKLADIIIDLYFKSLDNGRNYTPTNATTSDPLYTSVKRPTGQ